MSTSFSESDPLPELILAAREGAFHLRRRSLLFFNFFQREVWYEGYKYTMMYYIAERMCRTNLLLEAPGQHRSSRRFFFGQLQTGFKWSTVRPLLPGVESRARSILQARARSILQEYDTVLHLWVEAISKRHSKMEAIFKFRSVTPSTHSFLLKIQYAHCMIDTF